MKSSSAFFDVAAPTVSCDKNVAVPAVGPSKRLNSVPHIHSSTMSEASSARSLGKPLSIADAIGNPAPVCDGTRERVCVCGGRDVVEGVG